MGKLNFDFLIVDLKSDKEPDKFLEALNHLLDKWCEYAEFKYDMEG